MGKDAQRGREEGQPVDEAEQELQRHDGIDEPGQQALRDDGVLLDELGEVVEPRRCKGGESPPVVSTTRARIGKERVCLVGPYPYQWPGS